MCDLVVGGGVQKTSDESEILTQLKGKFATAGKSEKLQIFTILPQSCPIRKLRVEFGTSNWVSRKAKHLVKEKGIMSSPNPKPGHSLPVSTVDLGTRFYENDENSRLMPGKKIAFQLELRGSVSVFKRD